MTIKTAPISKFLPGLVLALSTLAFAQPSFAQATLALTAIPPRLQIEVRPGKVAVKEIKVRNETAVDQFVTIKKKDFIVTDNLGTPKILSDSEDLNNRWAASSWIQVSPMSLKLKPGETKSLTLTVIAPDNALPGGHYAVVLHSPTTSSETKGTAAKVETNVGTLVYITVPGKIKQSALLNEFTAPAFQEYGPVEFNSTIENLSDIHIAPQGSITVTNMLGGKVADLTLDETNIFPLTSRSFKNVLDKKFLFGRYKAQLTANYGTAGGVLLGTLFFWVLPWRLILVLLTIIAVIIALFLINKNKPQNGSSGKIEELEAEIEELKNKYKDRK
ncbi:MAG TPA: hypothetical protein VF828_01530 [Patescibacteria group bacterium]